MQFDPNLVEEIFNTEGCRFYVDQLKGRRDKVIAIVGPGRCGKDTLATAFARLTEKDYKGTCSLAAAELVYKTSCRLSPDGGHKAFRQFYANRHHYREFFFHCLNAFRDFEPLVVPALATFEADLLVGVRSKHELKAALPYIDHCIWVHRNGTPVDPTLEFTWPECFELFGENNCTWFSNNGSVSNLVVDAIELFDRLGLTITLAPKDIPYTHTNGLVIGA